MDKVGSILFSFLTGLCTYMPNVVVFSYNVVGQGLVLTSQLVVLVATGVTLINVTVSLFLFQCQISSIVFVDV